ncbi:MAG: ABC transporter permease [Asgard group archaeon]|nr:ABC transporter permease [Asgard group archaeon]
MSIKNPDEVIKKFLTQESSPSFFKGLKALFVRNMKIIWQYKFSLLMGFINTLVVTSLFFYISLLVPDLQMTQDNYTVDSISFIFAGVLLLEISTKILMKSMNSFTSEMKQGTFETLATLPFGLRRYFISEIAFEVLYGLILSTVYFIPIFFIFPVFRAVSISAASFFSLLLVALCTILFFFSLSLLAANFTILNKRGKEIAMVLIGIMHLLSGSLFPLQLFPKWLEHIAHASPFTFAVQAFRLCLFGQGVLSDNIIWGAVLFLILSSIVLIATFYFTFNSIYKRIRITGTIHEF